MGRFIACSFFCASALLAAAQPAMSAPGAKKAQLAGVWRGHSVCTVKNSPCHDEINVYRISPIPGKPGEFQVSADKVVDGKEEAMGSGNWKYDETTQTLTYEFPHGAFRLKLEGEELNGDLKLPDGTVYRLILLQKEK